MNGVNSNAWLDYYSPNASFFATPIDDPDRLVVPSVTVNEVFKRVLPQRDEHHALHAAAVMQQGSVVDLDLPLALAAARLSVETRLPMADSLVFATARVHNATLWTQDAGLRGCYARAISRKAERLTGSLSLLLQPEGHSDSVGSPGALRIGALRIVDMEHLAGGGSPNNALQPDRGSRCSPRPLSASGALSQMVTEE